MQWVCISMIYEYICLSNVCTNTYRNLTTFWHVLLVRQKHDLVIWLPRTTKSYESSNVYGSRFLSKAHSHVSFCIQKNNYEKFLFVWRELFCWLLAAAKSWIKIGNCKLEIQQNNVPAAAPALLLLMCVMAEVYQQRWNIQHCNEKCLFHVFVVL